MKNITILDKLLLKLNILLGFPFSLRLKPGQLDSVAKSEFFDAEWFQQELLRLGLNHKALSRLQLLQVYLKLGVKYCLNPSQDFDTEYYLRTNPDVKDRGLNPLVHYVLFGQYEARQPKDNLVANIVESLWGGQSNEALKHLKRIEQAVEQPKYLRVMAAWEQARWYSHIGDDKKSFYLAQKMAEIDSAYYLEKGRILLLAVCALRCVGSVQSASKLLDKYIETIGFDADVLLCMANFAASDAKRLAIINQVYQSYQLKPIVQRSNDSPLTMANIKSDPSQRVAAHNNEKVSVIVPLYNSETSILGAIESLLNQTWGNIEILVVDDCSTDSSYSLVEVLCQSHSHVRLLQTQQNSGAYAARNMALEHASGDFITTHDADDWSHPQKIELQVKALRDNSQAKGVMAHWVRCTHELLFTQNWRPSHALIHQSHSSFLFKREILEQLGEWDEVRVGADTEFMWRMRKVYGEDSIMTVHKEFPLAFALDDGGSLTRAKATHVKTINFGVRHLYRLSSMYWHQSASDLKLSNGSARQFYVPEVMQRGGASKSDYDVLIVADLHRDRLCPELVKLIADMSARSVKIALLHWPKFATGYQWLSPKVFEFADAGIALPVVYGQMVHAAKVVVSSSLLVSTAIDSVPEVEGIEHIFMIDDGEFAKAGDNFSELFGQALPEIQRVDKGRLRSLLLK